MSKRKTNSGGGEEGEIIKTRTKKSAQKNGLGVKPGVQILSEAADVDIVLGSNQKLDDLFKKAKSTSALTNEELKKAEQEMKKFLGQTDPVEDEEVVIEKEFKSKGKDKVKKKSGKRKKKRVVEEGIDMSFGTSELVRQTDDILAGFNNEIVEASSSTQLQSPPTSRSRYRTRSVRKNKKKDTRSACLNPVEEICISDSDEEVTNLNSVSKKGKDNPGTNRELELLSSQRSVIKISDDEADVDLGHILLFHAELKSEKFPIRMYEEQFVRDLRAIIAEKAKTPIESLQMFLGDYVQLEDDRTLLESGIRNMCTVETYLVYKSERDLYNEGSASVFKFKLQTEDRRGRADSYVFVRRDGQMQSAIDQYAQDVGLSATTGMKLCFDGEVLNLTSTPEECELEGGECLDLLLS